MEIQRVLEPFPPKQPLLNPNWTRGIFSTRLSQAVQSRRIDFPAVLRGELRAEPLLRLPWRQMFTLSKGVRCFIDVGAPLDILIEDRAQALQALRALAGFERVSVGFFETVPDGADARIEAASEFFAAAESPLLLLTDFGRYAMVGRRWALTEEWLAFAERERERGTSRIVALTPVPRSEWPAALLPEIEIVLWDWKTGVGKGRGDAR